MFVSELNKYIKSNKLVDYPLDNFNPSNYLASNVKTVEDILYRCTAIVVNKFVNKIIFFNFLKIIICI